MNTARDKTLQSIRPNISFIENNAPFVRMQNTCLRPICKMQNDFLLIFIEDYIYSKNKSFKNLDKQAKRSYIDSLFTKDSTFKHSLIGSIIGFFTQDELLFYTQNKLELNKRITQLIKTRFLSQFKEIE